MRKDNSKYVDAKKELNPTVCVFCGKPLSRDYVVHHLDGRDGEKFYDTELLAPVHGRCHIDYHHYPLSDFVLRYPNYIELCLKMYPKYKDKLIYKLNKINIF